ncbi:hypothetical protein [Kitasatospora paranensis]
MTIEWGCAVDGRHSTACGVNRPATGTTAIRDVHSWSPCRL